MSYLSTIEISRVQMAPTEEASYTTGGSKKATYIMVGIKFLELCLLISCIGLVDDPATHCHTRSFITPRVIALCYVTFGSLIIYTSIYLIMAMFGDIITWRSATLWSLVAFALFVTTSALLFRDWSQTKDFNGWHPNMQRLDFVLATACVSLVGAVIYLADLLLTLRLGTSGDLE